jgi:pimeloyl-ACP methyl ester carboxylesterase
MKQDKKLRLEDGRLLGYEVYGDPEGSPVFYFHGFPGSRLEARLATQVAARLAIRLIALDRPGFGLSDFKLRRTILEWPDDVIKIANALGISRFAILGVSGGGPYAAACALRIPERLTAVGIVCGLGPLDSAEITDRMTGKNRWIFFLARRLPWVARISLWRTACLVQRNPERMLGTMMGALPDPDKTVLTRPEVKTTIKENVVEAFRSGSRGAACELLLLTRPWGFSLKDIATHVHLWHGEQDESVPPNIARYQARTIPTCRASFYPGEGHFSLVINHMEEILSSLLKG